MAGRLGGNAPKSLGKHGNQAAERGARFTQYFNQGESMATARKNPTDSNRGSAVHTSTGTSSGS